MHDRVNRHWPAHLPVSLLVIMGFTLLSACGGGHAYVGPNQAAIQVAGGNADAGKKDIQKYGCGSCHVIPGVGGAHGDVGPPLSGIGTRRVIAGMLANDPGNMEHWLQDPQSVVPGN